MKKPFKGDFPITQGMLDTGAAKTGKAHNGIDFGLPEGHPLLAVVDGEISAAGFDDVGGVYIKIKKGEMSYEYFHMQSYSVVSGQHVEAGQQIGLAGSTGVVTGPHLHFQVRKNGKFVDPMELLNTKVTVKNDEQPEKISGDEYVIKKGDTFWELEERLGLEHGKLQQWNPKIPPRELQIGAKIRIKPPKKAAQKDNPTAHTIVRGDTFWDLERKYRIPHGKLQKLNPGMNPRFLRIGEKIRLA